jgi:uncharacterized protein (DUF2062 family)
MLPQEAPMPSGGAAGQKALVVIPVYNHSGTLREVARRTLAVAEHLLVVDDGSTEPAAKEVEGLALTLVSHAENRGKGAAILTAARYAAEAGYSHLITLDADGQHHPEDLTKFMAALEEDPAAIYVGCRDFDTPNVPGSSRFGRKFSNFWLRVQTGCELADVQSGFRAYPVGVLTGLNFSETRFAFEVEVLVKAAWAGVALKDVAIGVTYLPPGVRVSHFNKVRDNVRLTILNTKLTTRSMVPWRTHTVKGGEGSGADVGADTGAGGVKVSALHPLRSLKLLLTEDASPSRLAAAVGVGVFLGTLPLVGVQMLSIMAVAGFLRLNRVAAIGAGQLCSPPLVPALCIEAGYFMRNGEFLTELSLRTLGYEALDRILEWVLGSLVVAPVLAATLGVATWLTATLLVKAKRKQGET